MSVDTHAILAEVRAAREIREPALHFSDYWRTYVFMLIAGSVFVVLQSRLGPDETRYLLLYLAFVTGNLVAVAIKDGQRAINRKFDRLVALLEKRGAL